MTVGTLSAEQVEVFRETVQPVYDEWVPKIGREAYEAALADMEGR